jgi:hypothetical protein
MGQRRCGVEHIDRLRQNLLNEAAYTTKEPLLAVAGEPRFSSKGEKPVPGSRDEVLLRRRRPEANSSVEADSTAEAEVIRG